MSVNYEKEWASLTVHDVLGLIKKGTLQLSLLKPHMHKILGNLTIDELKGIDYFKFLANDKNYHYLAQHKNAVTPVISTFFAELERWRKLEDKKGNLSELSFKYYDIHTALNDWSIQELEDINYFEYLEKNLIILSSFHIRNNAIVYKCFILSGKSLKNFISEINNEMSAYHTLKHHIKTNVPERIEEINEIGKEMRSKVKYFSQCDNSYLLLEETPIEQLGILLNEGRVGVCELCKIASKEEIAPFNMIIDEKFYNTPQDCSFLLKHFPRDIPFSKGKAIEMLKKSKKLYFELPMGNKIDLDIIEYCFNEYESIECGWGSNYERSDYNLNFSDIPDDVFDILLSNRANISSEVFDVKKQEKKSKIKKNNDSFGM